MTKNHQNSVHIGCKRDDGAFVRLSPEFSVSIYEEDTFGVCHVPFAIPGPFWIYPGQLLKEQQAQPLAKGRLEEGLQLDHPYHYYTMEDGNLSGDKIESTMRQCSKCETEKSLEEFGKYKSKRHKCGYAIDSWCLKCRNIAHTARYHNKLKNSVDYIDSRKAYKKEHYQKNKDSILKKCKEYRMANLEQKKIRDKIYREANRQSRNRKVAMRKKTDPQYKLSCYLRSRLYKAINSKCKSGSAVGDLGCSVEYVKSCLQSQFKPNWTWNNWGKVWQLDHIIPLSKFDLTDREQFLKACRYTNLQSLSVEDHYKKTAEEIKNTGGKY